MLSICRMCSRRTVSIVLCSYRPPKTRLSHLTKSFSWKVRSTRTVRFQEPPVSTLGDVKNKFEAGIVYAIPPWILIRLGALGKPFAIFLGRRLRQNYKRMPQNDKDKLHRILLSIFSGAACFLMAVYFANIEAAPITGRRRFVLFSRETIAEMSLAEAESLTQQLAPHVLPPNHPAYTSVRRVARRLLEQSPVDVGIGKEEWRISIIEGDEVNAFVLPCGWIFVFTGLLELCDNDDRLSMILAHEIAHCLLGHPQEMTSQATLLQMLLFLPLFIAWMVLPSDSISVASAKIADLMSAFFLSLPHSRTMETEADIVGLNLAADACYDVREATVFWKLMKTQEERKQDAKLPEIWSTHPSHETRVATLEKHMPDALERRMDKGCPVLPVKDFNRTFKVINEAFEVADRDGTPVDLGFILRRLK